MDQGVSVQIVMVAVNVGIGVVGYLISRKLERVDRKLDEIPKEFAEVHKRISSLRVDHERLEQHVEDLDGRRDGRSKSK